MIDHVVPLGVCLRPAGTITVSPKALQYFWWLPHCEMNSKPLARRTFTISSELSNLGTNQTLPDKHFFDLAISGRTTKDEAQQRGDGTDQRDVPGAIAEGEEAGCTLWADDEQNIGDPRLWTSGEPGAGGF